MVAKPFRNKFLMLLTSFIIMSTALSLIPEAIAKATHPIFDRCGEYTVFGLISCTADQTSLIQNPGTDSEFRIRMAYNQIVCEFYRDRPVRLNIHLRSLDLNTKAMIMDQSAHRVRSVALMVPPQLKKESPCE